MESKCEKCGHVCFTHIHHKDFNHENNKPENLQSLCPGCHRLTHAEEREFTAHENIFDGVPVAKEEIKKQYISCFPR